MPEVSEILNFALRELINLFYCGNLYRSKSLSPNHPLWEDLQLFANVSDLIFGLRPDNFPRDLRTRCSHGGRWVFNSTQLIDDFGLTVTYALVKEKLKSFMASAAFTEITWQEPVYHQILPVVPSLLDDFEQACLEHTLVLLVGLYYCSWNALLVDSGDFSPHDKKCIKKVATLIFRRPSRKPDSRSFNALSTCFEFGQLFLSRSDRDIPAVVSSVNYGHVYERIQRCLAARQILKQPLLSAPHKEVKDFKTISPSRDAADGSEVIHHRRHKLDRGGRVFRLGSDISHSGSDFSPIWTSPLHASLLPPLTIVRQRELLELYCKGFLSDGIKEAVKVEYVEKLHILLESDSRLGVFVPKEVVAYLLNVVLYNYYFVRLSCLCVDWQTHVISILCTAVRSSELDKVMRKKVLESILKMSKSGSIYVKAELLFGLTRLSKVDEYRHLLLELGVLEILLEVSRVGNPAIIPDCALLLSVICFAERNLPDTNKTRVLLLQIGRNFLRLRYCNYEATAQAFSALAYLSNERYVKIEYHPCKRLMLFISDYEDSIAVSALEVVGNIVRWGKVRQITNMIKNGLLERLRWLLSHKFIMVRKEACWIISNITVGRKMYLKDLCEVNLPNSLCNLLKADDLDLRMEAVWAIFNSIIYDDDDEQIDYPNRSSTRPYILGQTRKIAPEPSLRVMTTRWRDYVPEMINESSPWGSC